MKRWLSENVGSAYVDSVSRRELFRFAAEHQLIDEVDEWMFFHMGRNQTSHSYDEKTALEIFDASKKFALLATQLLETLEKRND